MRAKDFIAALAIAALPVCALAQQPGGRNAPTGPKPTVADVQRIVSIISGDKAKTQVYCDMMKLDEQVMQAERRKDMQKAEQIGRQIDQMAVKLGPEYNTLMENLQQIDPNSKEGEQLSQAFDSLEKLCKK